MSDDKFKELFSLSSVLVSNGEEGGQITVPLRNKAVNSIKTELLPGAWQARSQIALGLTGYPGDGEGKGKDWLWFSISRNKQDVLSVSAEYHNPPSQPLKTSFPIPLELHENVGLDLTWVGPVVSLRIYTLSARDWPEMRHTVTLRQAPSLLSIGTYGAPTEAWWNVYAGTT